MESEGEINLDFSEKDLQYLLLEASAAGATSVMGVGATSNVSRSTVDEMIVMQAAELRDRIINLAHSS